MWSIASGASHSVSFVRTCVLESVGRRDLRAWSDFFASSTRCRVSCSSVQTLSRKSRNHCRTEVAHTLCRPFKKKILSSGGGTTYNVRGQCASSVEFISHSRALFVHCEFFWPQFSRSVTGPTMYIVSNRSARCRSASTTFWETCFVLLLHAFFCRFDLFTVLRLFLTDMPSCPDPHLLWTPAWGVDAAILHRCTVWVHVASQRSDPDAEILRHRDLEQILRSGN